MSDMRYRLATVDIARPLPTIALDADESGLGLTVRLEERPIGFLLRELPAGTTLDPAAIEQLLGPAERTALIAERLRRELLDARTAAQESPASTAATNAAIPMVTAVVCTHDRAALLARCVDSLVALQARGAARAPKLEILVIDNAPSDQRTRELVLRIPGVRYVCEPAVGLDVARNRGLMEANGEFVAYFDDDVTVDPAWLEGFAEAWTEHTDLAAVTGPVLPLELATRAQIEFERLGGFGHRFRKRRFGPTLPGDDVYPCGPGIFGAGCNMAFRRDVLRNLGGFDEALDTGASLPGGGDLDIFYRLVHAGHVLVTEPRCLVLHQHRREYARLRHQLWTWGLGLMAFVGKSYRAEPAQRPKFRRLIRWWAVRALGMLVRRARGGDAPPADLVIAELAGGLVGLCGEYGRSQRRMQQTCGTFTRERATRGRPVR